MNKNKEFSDILDNSLQTERNRSKGLPTYSTKESTALSAFNSSKAELKPTYKNEQIESVSTTFKGTKIKITDYVEKQFSFTASTGKTLRFLQVLFALQNRHKGKADSLNCNIVVPKDTILDMLGVPTDTNSRKKARKQLNQDIESLFKTAIELPNGTGFHVLITRNTNTSTLCVTLHPDFAKHLYTTGAIVYTPPALFKVSNRNPLAWELGTYLANYYNHPENAKNGRNDILKIRSILAFCANLPSVEKVDKDYKRDKKNKIIVPFEKAMNELVNKNVLKDWEYRNNKNIPYKNKNTCTSFTDFQLLCIVFHCKESDPIEL